MLSRSPQAPTLLRVLLAPLLAVLLAVPASAYDVPLTESSIRDAYFLGTRLGGVPTDFSAQYARSIPDLRQGNCTSQLRIETPFLQIASYVSSVPNYSSQDAVKEFREKPLLFRMHFDICYRVHAPLNGVRLKIFQNKKELTPSSLESSPYSERTQFGFLPPNGEQLLVEFAPAKVDSSDMSVQIETTDGQRAEFSLDLQRLR